MNQNREKDLAINTLIIGIGRFSTQIVSFLLLPLYSSILTTDEFGVYDLIVTISIFMLPAITLLMEEAMFRFLIDCKSDEEKKSVISQTIIYITISSCVFLLLSIILQLVTTLPYVLIGTIYIITSVITAVRNTFVRGLGRLKLYTLVNTITSIIHIVLNVIFIAFLRTGFIGLLISAIISDNLASFIVFLVLRIDKYISFKNYDKALTKKMIKYALPLVPNSLSWTIVNLSDRFVIYSFLGASANGIYSMSYKFPTLIDTIYSFFYTAWKESSAKAIKDDDKVEFYNKILKVLTNFMFSVSLGIIVCMPLVFNIFIKSAFSEAYLYIPILVISMYYNNMSGFYGGIFSAYKDTNIMGSTTIIGAIINIVVDIVLIRYIGIYAAAISTLASCMVIYYYRRIKIKKYVELKHDKIIVGFLLLVLTMALYYYNSNIWIKLINLVVVATYAFLINKDTIMTILSSVSKNFSHVEE